MRSVQRQFQMKVGVAFVAVVIATLGCFYCATGVLAQESVKPAATNDKVVSEVDALKLDKLILTQQNLISSIEVLQGRIKQLTDEAPKADAALKAFIAKLENGTHMLTRDDKGGYILTPKPPAPPSVEKK